MARTWLGRTVKRGIKLSLIAQGRVSQVGQHLAGGWKDLINEASRLTSARKLRRSTRLARNGRRPLARASESRTTMKV